MASKWMSVPINGITLDGSGKPQFTFGFRSGPGSSLSTDKHDIVSSFPCFAGGRFRGKAYMRVEISDGQAWPLNWDGDPVGYAMGLEKKAPGRFEIIHADGKKDVVDICDSFEEAREKCLLEEAAVSLAVSVRSVRNQIGEHCGIEEAVQFANSHSSSWADTAIDQILEYAAQDYKEELSTGPEDPDEEDSGVSPS